MPTFNKVLLRFELWVYQTVAFDFVSDDSGRSTPQTYAGMKSMSESCRASVHCAAEG